MQTYQQGTELCGRFVLLEKIGSGGHAEVWRASDAQGANEIALKVLHPRLVNSPEAWRALQREHEVSQRLSHPRIAEVSAPIRDDSVVVLPMALAHGDLRRLRGETYTRIVPLAMEIADALAHAHERGVVHRDLKPSNVLIDAQGHISISDFGVATLDGEQPTSGFGSPFTASPQQLRGERPAPADDIYGLGSLLYELLSGYPPYYPDFDATRALTEPVPDLLPIHPVPPRLAVLILRMLAKDAGERPGAMREVCDELGAALLDTISTRPLVQTQDEQTPDDLAASPSGSSPAISLDRDTDVSPAVVDEEPTLEQLAPVIPPEHAQAVDVRVEEALQPAPGAAAAPRPRRWGAAAGLIVLAVALGGFFLLLPRFAPQRAIVVVPPQAGAPGGTATSPGSEAQAARTEIQELQKAFADRLTALEARAAPVWGGPLFAAAKSLAADSDAALRIGNLELARDRIATATRRLERVEAQARAAFDSQIAEGERALAAGEAAVARQAYELALQIQPDDARAQQGLKRAGGLDGLLPVIAAADNAATARDYAKSIQLYGQVLRADPVNQAARDGLARVTAAAGGDAYARAIGEAFEALRGARLDAASAALSRARALRPDGAEVAAGLAELASARASGSVSDAKLAAERFEAQERWSDALAEYRRLLAQEATLAFARAGVERAEPRAELAARLQGLIDNPGRLIAAEVRGDARGLIARAGRISNAGPVLRSQVVRIELLLPTYEQPVRVAFVSDGLTSIVVQRFGSLGAFDSKEVELTPGRYTVIGTREGFRDVRREISVAPGAAAPAVDVRCIDPI